MFAYRGIFRCVTACSGHDRGGCDDDSFGADDVQVFNVIVNFFVNDVFYVHK